MTHGNECNCVGCALERDIRIGAEVNARRIAELERKIAELEAENAALRRQIEAVHNARERKSDG